ncbi:hypothetical protein KC799_14645 [candidate division KSB1 bacterium]|nr:hypothetical protein [candidate division KSB1 bacterium]
MQKIFKGQVVEATKNQLLQIVEFEPACNNFYNRLYGLNSFAVGKHWMRLIFAGERVLPPKNFSDVDKFIEFLIKQKKGIGFLPVSIFKTLKSDSIKALIIENKNYMQPGYRLTDD